VHPEPEHALSDGPQSLDFKEFEKLYTQTMAMEHFMTKLKGGETKSSLKAKTKRVNWPYPD
jgi:3-deoxy-D-manno-octulosonic acid (KDO) 8-phosphate synthase